jgi:hypothetical protein
VNNVSGASGLTLVVTECCLLPPRRGPGRGHRCGHGGRPVAAMHATGQGEGASRGNPCGQSKTVCNGYLYIFPLYHFLCHIINISSPTFSSPAAVPSIFFPIPHYNYKISLSKSTHHLLPFFHLLKTNTTNKQCKGESGTHAICSVLLFPFAA